MASWSIESIQKAERRVTGAADCRMDSQLMNASYLNCPSMLSTAPMTVAVMGHLTLVTIHKDVDLRREGGYKYIKYPESLRASTVHLANEACSTFSLAEKNMDQIRIYTRQIPGHVQSAVKMLLQGTKHEIAQVMPHYLTLLENTADICEKKSKEVEDAFLFVKSLTEELKEACTLTGSGPKMSKVESTGPLDAYVKQAYFKVESAEAALKAAKKDFKQMTEKLEKEKERNLSLMTDLANVNLDKINFEEIKELMQKCLYALAEIREQWGKLVRFFTTLSNNIDSTLYDSLGLFTKTIKSERDTSLPYGFSDAMIDTIYQQTAKANKIAFMTSDISGMYLNISQEHLTDPLARMGKLLALDPKKDEQLIKDKQKELTWQCESATRAVGNFIARKKEEFDSRIDARIQKIDRELRAVLPPKVEDSPEIKRMKEQSVSEAEELKRKRQEEMDHFC